MNYYVVHTGRNPGIYKSWEECKKQIDFFSGAKYKKFSNRDEAEYYLKHGPSLNNIQKKNEDITNNSIKHTSIKKQSIISLKHIKTDTQSQFIYIYTDGSCRNNGKKNATGGVGIHFSDSKFDDISLKYEGIPTNNKMELYAIYISIKYIENYINNYDQVIIFTDSQYAIDCLTKYIKNWIKNDWKTKDNRSVLNKEIINSIYELLSKYEKLSFNHIRSHTGKNDIHSLGNEIADNLAYKAASF